MFKHPNGLFYLIESKLNKSISFINGETWALKDALKPPKKFTKTDKYPKNNLISMEFRFYG